MTTLEEQLRYANDKLIVINNAMLAIDMILREANDQIKQLELPFNGEQRVITKEMDRV